MDELKQDSNEGGEPENDGRNYLQYFCDSGQIRVNGYVDLDASGDQVELELIPAESDRSKIFRAFAVDPEKAHTSEFMVSTLKSLIEKGVFDDATVGISASPEDQHDPVEKDTLADAIIEAVGFGPVFNTFLGLSMSESGLYNALLRRAEVLRASGEMPMKSIDE